MRKRFFTRNVDRRDDRPRLLPDEDKFLLCNLDVKDLLAFLRLTGGLAGVRGAGHQGGQLGVCNQPSDLGGIACGDASYHEAAVWIPRESCRLEHAFHDHGLNARINSKDVHARERRVRVAAFPAIAPRLENVEQLVDSLDAFVGQNGRDVSRGDAVHGDAASVQGDQGSVAHLQHVLGVGEDRKHSRRRRRSVCADWACGRGRRSTAGYEKRNEKRGAERRKCEPRIHRTVPNMMLNELENTVSWICSV